MKNNPEQIGNKVKLLMKQKNITVKELSEASRLSAATIRNYVRGESVAIWTLAKIVKLLGGELSSFFSLGRALLR